MSTKNIKAQFNTRFNICQERIVDVDRFTIDGLEMVTITTISKHHTVWRNSFLIEDGSLVYIKAECL
jgi:hypothetical protein